MLRRAVNSAGRTVSHSSALARAGASSARASYYTETREPFHPISGVTPKVWEDATEMVGSVLKSGQNVFVHSAAATPNVLTSAMSTCGVDNHLHDITVAHIHTEGAAPYMDEGMEKRFRSRSMFTGPNARKAVNDGRGDYVPVFLSEIPLLFRRGVQPVQVALISVSPPDSHGFCSLGPSVDVTRAAIQVADVILAQVNPSMPRTFGDGVVHVSHLDGVLELDTPLHAHDPKPPSAVEKKIGGLIAEHLVADGATLQMGIGAIPDATLAALGDHKDLGIHTEMFSDGVVDLVESGVITNAHKAHDAGKMVTSFAVGSKRLYDFLHDNPYVVFYGADYTNDTAIIRKNPRVTAINSAIEVDLTGQVVADSIGNRIYSGVGGQVDFIRGAGLADHGVPIIALPSVTSKGLSRIVPQCKPGGGVVTTRAHVHHIVTEYGIANLWGKSIRERAHALIAIAHPDHRDALAREAHSQGLI